MKTITILGPMPPLKGVSQYLEGFVQALAKHTHVQVLSFDQMYPEALYPGGTYKDDNKVLAPIPNAIISNTIDRRNPFSWIKAALSIKGEVLHMQYWIRFLAPVYFTIGLIAKYIKKIPVIITIHNVLPHEGGKWKLRIDKIVYSIADHFIVHSQDNKQQLQELIGKNKDIHIFPHGIITHAQPKADKQLARENLSIAQDSKVLLAYGNIRAYKGLKLLLQALHELVQQDHTYHLIIAGQCREDRNQYQEIIDQHHLQKHITRINKFVSEQESAIIFGASDLLVLPYTHFDAQSGVIALGLGYEVPMIVSNLGGLVEIVDDKKHIFLRNNCKSLVTTIVQNKKSASLEYIKTLKNRYARHEITSRYIQKFKL